MDTISRPLALADADALDPGLVGRKAAVLARLLMAGFDVPEGLVLPAEGAASASDGSLSRRFAEEVVTRWAGPVAVRTSATWEDLDTAAHAGRTLTELHVLGVDEVAAAVRRCLAHARSLQGGPGPSTGGAAILVQPMLTPSHAGVAFTADPTSGARDVVRLGAVEGVAEPLVSGAANGIDILVRGARVVGDRGTLPTADALAVAAVARQVELLLGAPQDVEWAVVDGRVWVLQARPITVLPIRPQLPPGGGWQKDIAHYSEPLTAFGFDELQAGAAVVPEVFAASGFLIDGLEEVNVGGEIYGRVVPAVGAADPGPVPPPPARVLGLLARIAPPLRARTAAARRMLEDGVGEDWMQEWERERPRYVERTRALAAADLRGMDDDGLATHHHRVRALNVDGTRIHFKVVVPYVLALYRLHRLLCDLHGWDEAATAALLAGASPATHASEVALSALRARVASVPGAAAALSADPDHPVDALGAVAPDLGADLDAWIAEHGWRARNYDAGAPVLAERPRVITRLVLAVPDPVVADAGERAADRARALLPADSRAGFDEALAQARRCYPLREDTVIVAGDVLLGLHRRWLLEVGRRLVARSWLAQPDDAAHLLADELLAALAGRSTVGTVRESVVRRRGEAAWTRANPGPVTIGRQSPPPDISALPDPLRQVNEAVLWFVGLEYPGEVEGDAGDPEVLLRGVAASPGVAVGPVRVVHDHRDLDRLEEGEVLVCQTTSPAWAPMFPLAAAIIADGGGAMSHAAIAAREHGLPAVLGTASATRDLVNGQRVRADGTTGRVSAAS